MPAVNVSGRCHGQVAKNPTKPEGKKVRCGSPSGTSDLCESCKEREWNARQLVRQEREARRALMSK